MNTSPQIPADQAPQAPASPVQATPAPAVNDKDAVQAVTEAKTENDPDFASKFAALTRKQKEIFIREQQLKQREEKISKYESLEKLKSENPFKYIQEQGMDLDSIIKGAAKDGEPPSVEDKVAALEKKIADYEAKIAKDQEDAVLRKQQEQVDSFKNTVFDKVKADPERYELIHLEDAFGTVYEVIEEHFVRTQKELGTGEVLDTEKAAEMVEKFLQEKATKLLQAKKLGFKMAETSASPSPAKDQSAEPAKQNEHEALTLSSSLIPSSAAPDPKNETPDEAKRRIAAEFNARFRASKAG